MSKDTDNIKNSRPLSPHLGIYKPQITSMLSIGHRLSGVGLFFVLAATCWWFALWVFSRFDPAYLDILDNNFVKTILIIASYGFFYHLCTGIRHLIWDTGRCFSICAVHYTGWLAIIGSLALTLVYWLYI
ncbi:MAG: succinate dehydrogenase, cytochrome b556 subunit [Rickettsiales bacterium]|nr:MAG: succinate dehydrogenase, cytochrome b556 subunit [Rickettsiales bacterium]